MDENPIMNMSQHNQMRYHFVDLLKKLRCTTPTGDRLIMESAGDTTVPLLYGQVTHIVDPSDFWVKIGTEKDLTNFRDFEQQLNPVAWHLPVGSVEEVTENCMVLVRCSKPGSKNKTMWKRATVIRVSREENTFDILYIDYGNTEIVQGKRICPRVPEDVQEYPVDCYRCALAGIKPIAKSWTTRGIKFFTKLVSQGILQVALVSFDRSTLSHRVGLYKSGEGERSVTHQMLDKETGLPTEEGVEEFVKDVKGVSAKVLYGCILTDDQPEQCSSDLLVDNSSCSETVSGMDEYGVASNIPAFCGPADQQEAGCLDDESNENLTSETLSKTQVINGPDINDSEEDVSPTEVVVVPKFNLSSLQQRRMLDVEELQKVKDEELKAERKARLQQDMIKCHQELDDMGIASEERQNWGCTDLLISNAGRLTMDSDENSHFPDSSCHPQSFHHYGYQGRTLNLYPEDKGLKHCEDFIPTHDMKPQSPEPPEESKSNTDSANVSQCEENQMLSSENFYKPESDARAREHRTFFPYQPPEPQAALTPEERQQRYYKQILRDGAADKTYCGTACAEFHVSVPCDVDHSEKEMKVLMETLLEEAVTDENVRDLALEVICSYCNVLKGIEMLHLLRYGAEKFVKLPVGKMSAYHMNFAAVLIKLLFLAFDWPPLLKTVIQDYTFECLDNWLIFNKKGNQCGPIHRHLEKMYISCAEHILPPCLHVLLAVDSERVANIFEEMKEKVLQTRVDYGIRYCLLNLLVKFGDPLQERIEPSSVMPTSSHGKSVEGSRTNPSPFKQEPKSKSETQSVPVMEHGCQTVNRITMEAEKVDVAVQTDLTSGTLTSHNVSIDMAYNSGVPVGSSDRLEGASSAPGRARRRRAVLEYLSKHERFSQESISTNSSSPYTSPECANAPSSAADLFSLPSKTTEFDHDADLHQLSDKSDIAPMPEDRDKAVNSQAASLQVHADESERTKLGKQSDVSSMPNVRAVGGRGISLHHVFIPDGSKSSYLSAVSFVSKSDFLSMVDTPLGRQCADKCASSSSTVQGSVCSSSTLQEESDYLFHRHSSSVDTFPGGRSYGSSRAACKDEFYTGDHADVWEKNAAAVMDDLDNYDMYFASDYDDDENWDTDMTNKGYRSCESAASSSLAVEGEGTTENSFVRLYDDSEETIKSDFSGKKLYSGVGAKKFFTKEDFPPLAPKLSPCQNLVKASTTPTLSLQSIATNLLESPTEKNEGGNENRDQSVLEDRAVEVHSGLEGEIHPSRTRDVQMCGACHKSNDDDQFVPSDWEDRLSADDHTGSSSKVKGKTDGCVAVSIAQNYSAKGAGDFSGKDGSYCRETLVMNPSGDGCVQQKINIQLGNPKPDSIKERDCGKNVCAQSFLAGDHSSQPRSVNSSSSQAPAQLQTDGAVPYHRRDLAFECAESPSRRRRGRTKFRSLYEGK